MQSNPSTERPRHSFFGHTPGEIDNLMASSGLQRFRGQQVRDWVYTKFVTDAMTKMSNISSRDRPVVANCFDFSPGQVVRTSQSTDGTTKYLVSWNRLAGPDVALADHTTECVMIPDEDRRTACISSQVGCPVGCKFCASGLSGLKTNLEAAEIVYQVWLIDRALNELDGSHLTNLVFMGMGEPLSNFGNVIKAIRIIHDRRCMDMGARRITISTVGVPKRIRDLAEVDLPVNLALSLHAPNEPLRRQLIPWADHFALEEILDACRHYFDQSGREITLEYILLRNVNDRPEHARELVKICRSMRANVNLIRYNEVEGLPFQRPESDDVVTFQDILRDAGVNTHVRKSRGRDIDAACGQLRRRAQQEQLVALGGAK